MFSRLKRQLPVFVPLAAGLLIITLLTTLGGLLNYRHELDHQAVKGPAGATSAATFSKNTAAPGPNALIQTGPSGNAAGQNPPASSAGGSGSKPAAKSNAVYGFNASYPTIHPASGTNTSISLALSINGQTKGTVRLTAGSSQCDVLNQALSQGLISSLDMRYSSQYGTQAVYAINGLGDPASVWWTYTVNGKPPPYGCSYVVAHNGDSVDWKYIKS